jgi:polyisoprenoid-binding protein YceI
MRRISLLIALAGLAVTTLAAPAEWHVARADVRVVCPMTVGGSFEARTAALGGNLTQLADRPPTFDGALTVDLTTLDTGIDLRNDHLRNEYLEVGKGDEFAHAVLESIRLGDVDAATFQGKTSFTGKLRLHGASRPVAGTAEIRREGASVRVEAGFPVTLPDYGIAKPRYMGVGVKDQVQVKVSLAAEPVEAQK